MNLIGSTFKVEIPEGVVISNLGFATALCEQAKTYGESEEIYLKLDEGVTVDVKSILGLISLQYAKTKELNFQVIGENQTYTAQSLKRFVEKLVKLYDHDHE